MTSATLHKLDACLVRGAGKTCKTGDYNRDHRPPWRRATVCIALGIAAALLNEALSFRPDWLERYYANGLGAWSTRVLSEATRFAPFSVAEIAMALFFCWLVLPALPTAFSIARRRRSMMNALLCGATRAAGSCGLLVAVFYLLWGFNYARAAMPVRMGWDDSALAALPRMGTQSDRDELAVLCTQLVFVTNHYYEEAMGTRDVTVHSVPDSTALGAIDQSLETGFARAAALLGLDPSFAAPRGPAKPVFASRVMSTLGIAGFYAPWTGEANYNREVPPFQKPHTIAHEKAHQRCVASEDEANFFGFLACILSDNPYARYAGYLFAQRQLLGELVRIDPAAARAIIALRCKGVQADVNYGRMFWRMFRGRAQTLSHAINDAYLKANRVDAGMLSYQMSARLLVLFSRQNDGTCVVLPE